MVRHRRTLPTINIFINDLKQVWILRMLKNLSHRFRVRMSNRWLLALFIVLIVMLWLIPAWLNKPVPPVTHTLGSSTQHVDVLWFRQDLSPLMITASPNGVIFSMPLARDSLIAIDIKTGTTIWVIELPFERRGARDLLADNDTLFVVTTLNVDAYESRTGELMWSTRLGQGHVSVISQLDADLVRVYYGDKLYELDSETGKLLATIPKETTVWVSGNIILKSSTSNQLSTYDKQTGELLWEKDRLFPFDENLVPQYAGQDILLVAKEPSSSFIRGICALNLLNGEYIWCRPETFSSMMAVDRESQLGYIVRSDSVLLTIDLLTGSVLGETTFLSSEPKKEQPGFVSITISNSVVVVSFGDSLQTFGLKFLPIPG